MKKKLLRFVSFMIVFCAAMSLYANNTKLDSLWGVFSNAEHDTIKIKVLNDDIGRIYRNINPDSAIYFYSMAIGIAEVAFEDAKDEELGNRYMFFKATSLRYIGIANAVQGYYDQALTYFIKSLGVAEEIDDKDLMFQSINNIGVVQAEKGDYDKAIEYYHQALEIAKALDDRRGMSLCYINIGNIYYFRGGYKPAIEYYEKSLELAIEVDDEIKMSLCYNNMGGAHRILGNYNLAIDNLLKSVEISKRLGDKNVMAVSYSNISELNIALAKADNKIEPDKALEFLENAVKYGLMSIQLAEEINAIPRMNEAANTLMSAYEELEDFEKALKYAKVFISTKDSLFHEEKTRAVAEIQIRYDSEKKQQMIERQNLLIEKSELENRRQRLKLNFLFAGMAFFGLFAFLVFIAYRHKIKSSRIISEKNAMLEDANKEVKIQHSELTELNAELTSINEEIIVQKDELVKQKSEAEKQKSLVEVKNKEILEQKEEILKQQEILKAQSLKLEKINATLETRIAAEVSESRKKDFLLIQQSRQAAMGEMIANIAHQWRQPLNAVALIVQNFQDAFEHGELTQEYLEKKVTQSMNLMQYMSETINDFRDFFKPEKSVVDFDAKKIVKRCMSFVEDTLKKHNIELAHDLEDNVFINGFPNEYAQVIINLINNAKDALVDASTEHRFIKITLTKSNDKACLTVSDNGGGISEENKDKIFNPYFSTKKDEQGTGLGLYMSKTIIEKNEGGRLSFENTAEGARFIVIL